MLFVPSGLLRDFLLTHRMQSDVVKITFDGTTLCCILEMIVNGRSYFRPIPLTSTDVIPNPLFVRALSLATSSSAGNDGACPARLDGKEFAAPAPAKDTRTVYVSELIGGARADLPEELRRHCGSEQVHKSELSEVHFCASFSVSSLLVALRDEKECFYVRMYMANNQPLVLRYVFQEDPFDSSDIGKAYMETWIKYITPPLCPNMAMATDNTKSTTPPVDGISSTRGGVPSTNTNTNKSNTISVTSDREMQQAAVSTRVLNAVTSILGSTSI